MSERSFIVKYVSVKDSFIYISNKSALMDIGTYVRVTYNESNVGYFSVNHTSINLDHNDIGFSLLHAKALGIKENDIVFVSLLPSLPTVTSITVTPLLKNDYEILELFAETIQETLLYQVTVVYSRQTFVIWIGNNINVAVRVDKVNPVSPGTVGFLTEVHINPHLENFSENKSLNWSKLEWTKDLMNSSLDYDNGLQKFYEIKQDAVFRVIPLSKVPNLYPGKFDRIFDAFVYKSHTPVDWPQDSLTTPLFCCLKLLSDDTFTSKSIHVRMIFCEDINFKFDTRNRNNIYLNEKILEFFECKLGTKVIAELMYILPKIKEIEIYCKKNYMVNVVDQLKMYLARFAEDPGVLNRKFPINIGANVVCELKFLPDDATGFCIVDDNFLRNCKYYVNEENITLNHINEETVTDAFFIENIGSYHSIIQDVLRILSNTNLVLENILIAGKPGSGKSSLVRQLLHKLESHPGLMYTEVIKCKNVKGKTLESLFKLFSNTFSELILHQPSLLILDDLHVLCEHSKGDEAAPNNIYFCRISEMLHNLFKTYCSNNSIVICATAESTEKINKNIYTTRGSHLFKNIYTIKELNKDDRIHLLEKLFSPYLHECINFEDLSLKTEGYVVEDIMDFFNRTVFEAAKDDSSKSDILKISQEHCDRGLENTCVLALENVNLHSAGDKDFSDIGGLYEVKKILVETLLWPAKYPSIFASAPLRLQTGLLLYGPPGTGKTILAAAVAKQCRIRLISVKGPELLSKYIGASEQAVRDIFQKAQSARPCILFFDEFDSLAPRRGHDNTGVTDRVVNQLLTQLDGVEALAGVSVLAATSRPDLLDPALLRPGRLDRQILCALPPEEDRLEILKVLSKNLTVGSDVNLEKISVATEYFSGADLQSLLYTAQMSTIDHLLQDVQNTSTFESIITQKHLMEALMKTKPSLSKQERLKYERIYKKFQTGKTIEEFETGAKATLA